MALFPQGLTQVDARCNPGERRVLHQLKRCLNDDHLVWHNVPIGSRARQPDFVVLSPRQGLLLLEVKDWKVGTLVAANRDAVTLRTARGEVTEPHPLRQARDYAFELVGQMQADAALVHGPGPFQGKLLFPYGWGVVMSGLRQRDVASTDFSELFSPDFTLLRDDLDEAVDSAAFQARLWGMFTVSYPHTLTLPQRDRIRWHLFPEIRMPTQVGLDLADAGDGADGPPSLPDLLQVMDLQQEQIARTLGDGHRVIHGAAGSGKTMILIYRAQQLAAAATPGQPILVLCFNQALAERIAALLAQRGVDERVQVRTFHGWCEDVVRSYQLYVDAPRRSQGYFETLVATVERALHTGFVPSGQYSALLVDEAHDFEAAWLKMAVGLVNPVSNSLLVLYDDAQSIYQKQRQRFNFASVGIQARGRTSVLKLNYRNTAEVLALALRCAESLLQGATQAPADAAGGADADDTVQRVLPASAGRRGALPVLIEARNAQEEAELLAERIAALRAERPNEEVAVIYPEHVVAESIVPALRRHRLPFQIKDKAGRHLGPPLNWREPGVKLLTLHSVKGLEFDHVFIAGLQRMPDRRDSLDDALRLLYVGMTRATRTLVLSASGSSAVVERVREAMGAVNRLFSSPGGAGG